MFPLSTSSIQYPVLLRVKEQKNILHEMRKRKANWIGHILRRNCLLQRVIEGKIKGGIEVTGRRGRKRKKLLDDLKERKGYLQLKEEALDRSMWRARFGRGFGPVVRQTTKWLNSSPLWCYVTIFRFPHNQSDWYSPVSSSITFQNFLGIFLPTFWRVQVWAPYISYAIKCTYNKLW